MRFWRVGAGFPRPAKSLLARLLVYFLLLAVIPLAVVGFLAYYQGQRTLRNNILDHLTTTAILKEDEIDRWVESMREDSRLLAQIPFLQEQAETLLTRDQEGEEYVTAYQALKPYLDGVLAEKPDFSEILILKGVGGKVLLSTDSEHEGAYEVTSTFFTEGRKGTYVQNIYPSVSLGKPAMTVATPLQDSGGQVLGVLAIHLNLARLDDIMLERGGLGETGETYLVDRFNVFVSEARFGGESFPRGVHTEAIDAALLDKKDGAGIYTDYRGVQVIGAYRWLDEREMALLAELELNEALAPVRRLGLVILLIGVAGAGLVAAAAYVVARQISGPILALAEASSQMAGGDLSRTFLEGIRPGTASGFHREDEIGTLARAFNSMAAQLRDLIASLEQRVAERTRDLERRAVQLATAADVGRAAASILELETLTRQVVDLVRERFDLYYAGLFLLPVGDAGQYAVLEAGTGEAGRLMKEQGHKLQVGGLSMVGSACAQKQARIALDVGAEPVRFDNPLLPETRSEMALPLIVGDRVLGALDVQSTQPAAFSEEDITVLQLVADQVAVAVDNARKFSEETALLEATSPLYRVSQRLTAATTTDEVVQAIIAMVAETEADGCAVARFGFAPGAGDQVETITFLGDWDRHGASRFPLGVPFPASTAMFPLPVMTSFYVIEDMDHDPSVPEDTRQALARFGMPAVVNVPLRVGDRAIGFLILQRSTPGPFSAVGVRFYETLADQAAVALERATLLEDAQRRASREQLARAITDKIRRAADLDSLLRTVAQEMAAALGTSSAFVQLSTPLEPAGDGGENGDGGKER